jgi:uncharacterized protein YbjT (DUF2867 family)
MRIAVAGGTGTVGHHVTASVQQAGHEAVVLSRSRGVDVLSGDGLAGALAGVDVVIDTANPDAIEEGPATEFFTGVAASLQRAGSDAGVRHIVTLSIVGIDKTSFGYYRAKLAQESVASAGPVPSTIMRATQLYELPGQLIGLTRQDSQARVLDLGRVQPVAARTVGEVLVEVAEGAPAGRVPDLAGPQQSNLVALGQALVEHRHEAITVHPIDVGIPPGVLLPTGGARIEGPTFEEWLASEDAAALPL